MCSNSPPESVTYAIIQVENGVTRVGLSKPVKIIHSSTF